MDVDENETDDITEGEINDVVPGTSNTKPPKPNKKHLQGGNICCIPLCHTTSRRNKGVSLFKPTNIQNDFHREWNNEIYKVILRYRAPDKKFNELRAKKKVYVCEKHYAKEDIEFTKTGLKKVKLLALPTLNLPPKSHELAAFSRKAPSIRERVEDASANQRCYQDFVELSRSVDRMKLNEWTHEIIDNADTGPALAFRQKINPELILKYEIFNHINSATIKMNDNMD